MFIWGTVWVDSENIRVSWHIIRACANLILYKDTTREIGIKYDIINHHDPIIIQNGLSGIYPNYFKCLPWTKELRIAQSIANNICNNTTKIIMFPNCLSNWDRLVLNWTEFKDSLVYLPVYTQTPIAH